MGACCSKDGDIGTYQEKQIPMPENLWEEDQNHVIKGDFGSSIILQGCSDYVSMATQQGKKGINQDAMTVWENFAGDKNVIFCGVFDGHGPSGHKVSRHVRDQLPCKLSIEYKNVQTKGRSHSKIDAHHEDEGITDLSYVEDEEDLDSNLVFRSWKIGFIRSFQEIDKELSLDSYFDSYCSGATAVTVLRQGDNLIIGNLGDSRAVLCTKGGKGEAIPIQLTVDLKPSNTQEAERIKRCNGRVFALEEEPGVFRLWLPDEDCPGLAMTRAFGDFCLKDYGLISVPQLFSHRLKEQDEFVVLATDGVWDVLTNLEVVKIVSAAKSRSIAAKFLVAHAIRAWKLRFPGSKQDDIAVIVLFFKPPPATKASSDVSNNTGDTFSYLNSSVSQYTFRSISSDADEGFDFRANSYNKPQSEDSKEGWGEVESMVNTTSNFPRYRTARQRTRSMSNIDYEA